MAILGIYVRFLGCTWALGRRHWTFWNLCESHLGHFDYFWYLVAHGSDRNLQSGGRWVRTHTCLGDFFQPTCRSEVCTYNLQPNLPTIFSYQVIRRFVLEIAVGVIALAFGLSSGKSIYSDPNSRRERNGHPQMVVKSKGIPPKWPKHSG